MRKFYFISLNVVFVSMMMMLYLLYQHDCQSEKEFLKNGIKIHAIITDDFGVISPLYRLQWTYQGYQYKIDTKSVPQTVQIGDTIELVISPDDPSEFMFWNDGNVPRDYMNYMTHAILIIFLYGSFYLYINKKTL